MGILDGILYKVKELGWTIERFFTSKPDSQQDSQPANIITTMTTTNSNDSSFIPSDGYIMGIALGTTTVIGLALLLIYILQKNKQYKTIDQKDTFDPNTELNLTKEEYNMQII